MVEVSSMMSLSGVSLASITELSRKLASTVSMDVSNSEKLIISDCSGSDGEGEMRRDSVENGWNIVRVSVASGIRSTLLLLSGAVGMNTDKVSLNEISMLGSRMSEESSSGGRTVVKTLGNSVAVASSAEVGVKNGSSSVVNKSIGESLRSKLVESIPASVVGAASEITTVISDAITSSERGEGVAMRISSDESITSENSSELSVATVAEKSCKLSVTIEKSKEVSVNISDTSVTMVETSTVVSVITSELSGILVVVPNGVILKLNSLVDKSPVSAEGDGKRSVVISTVASSSLVKSSVIVSDGNDSNVEIGKVVVANGVILKLNSLIDKSPVSAEGDGKRSVVISTVASSSLVKSSVIVSDGNDSNVEIGKVVVANGVILKLNSLIDKSPVSAEGDGKRSVVISTVASSSLVKSSVIVSDGNDSNVEIGKGLPEVGISISVGIEKVMEKDSVVITNSTIDVLSISNISDPFCSSSIFKSSISSTIDEIALLLVETDGAGVCFITSEGSDCTMTRVNMPSSFVGEGEGRV